MKMKTVEIIWKDNTTTILEAIEHPEEYVKVDRVSIKTEKSIYLINLLETRCIIVHND